MSCGRSGTEVDLDRSLQGRISFDRDLLNGWPKRGEEASESFLLFLHQQLKFRLFSGKTFRMNRPAKRIEQIFRIGTRLLAAKTRQRIQIDEQFFQFDQFPRVDGDLSHQIQRFFDRTEPMEFARLFQLEDFLREALARLFEVETFSINVEVLPLLVPSLRRSHRTLRVQIRPDDQQILLFGRVLTEVEEMFAKVPSKFGRPANELHLLLKIFLVRAKFRFGIVDLIREEMSFRLQIGQFVVHL